MLKPKCKSLESTQDFDKFVVRVGVYIQGASSKKGHEKNANSEAIIITRLPHQGQGKNARRIKLLKV